MFSKSLTFLFICIFPFGIYTNVIAEESLSLYIITSEGGDISKSRLEKLVKYLNLNQCYIQNITHGDNADININTDFIFAPLHMEAINLFEKLSNIKIINNDKLSASVLVRGETGINSIKSLENVRIAFLSPNSITGYQLPSNIFQLANIIHSREKITFTQTNLAAVSLLLHKDVFAATIATPLAKKWAADNNLIIVVTSKEIEAGGLWVKKSLSAKTKENCSRAFTNLTKTGNINKKLIKLFPAWIDSFLIVNT